ncbi:hypothetical protein FB446DRAFT_792975 [Lentinula raphanica]|nr:hypothetical protein FB446DRAFT_792975 [Lentinula raphanica]
MANIILPFSIVPVHLSKFLWLLLRLLLALASPESPSAVGKCLMVENEPVVRPDAGSAESIAQKKKKRKNSQKSASTKAKEAAAKMNAADLNPILYKEAGSLVKITT